jgi:hypothetical protein
MQPHLTPYLSRHENDAEREGKGTCPGEYPCQLISATITSPRSVSATQDRECRENCLDTPPNAVSTHHLSVSHVDGQKIRTRTQSDAKNREDHPRTPNRPKLRPGQPPRMWAAHPTSPLPSSSWRDVSVHKTTKTSKQEQRASTKQGRQGHPRRRQPPRT